jgi:CheY-like chemotaxis protein
VNCGSTFEIRLPCLSAAASSRRRPPARRARPSVAPRRILIVDDSMDAAESLAMLMSLNGHEVTVSHDGLDALEVATRERPEVILLDIGLPGLDGYEVCRQLRERGLDDALIVAMTGYGQERDRLRSKSAGFDTHTVKPVDLENLMGLVACTRSTIASTPVPPSKYFDLEDAG